MEDTFPAASDYKRRFKMESDRVPNTLPVASCFDTFQQHVTEIYGSLMVGMRKRFKLRREQSV